MYLDTCRNVNPHWSSDARQPDQLRRDLCHAARGGLRGHFGGGGGRAGDGALHLPGWLGGSMGSSGPIWEWSLPPIYGDFGDGLLLGLPHYRFFWLVGAYVGGLR